MNQDTENNKTLGLIGYGNFGSFMLPYLLPHFKVFVYDPKLTAQAQLPVGATLLATPEQAATCDVVILAVPVQFLEALLQKIAVKIKPEALVADVGSVKIRPIELMLKYLPPHAHIIGTHPLFGPQSGKQGIAGQPMAICPVRLPQQRLQRVKNFLAKQVGLEVFALTPDAHDREMVYVQSLTHFIARAITDFDIPESPLATRAYNDLLRMKSMLQFDSRDLFITIERENPYAQQIRTRFLDKLHQIDDSIKNFDPNQKNQ